MSDLHDYADAQEKRIAELVLGYESLQAELAKTEAKLAGLQSEFQELLEDLSATRQDLTKKSFQLQEMAKVLRSATDKLEDVLRLDEQLHLGWGEIKQVSDGLSKAIAAYESER